MKEAPKQAKGVGAFSFWGGFEARIQSTGSLPDLHLHFRNWGALAERKTAPPVRSGVQYRQDPLLRGDPLTPDGAKHP
jgi:hypothetical protein